MMGISDKSTERVKLLVSELFEITKNDSLIPSKKIFKSNGVQLSKKHGVSNGYNLKFFITQNVLKIELIKGINYCSRITPDFKNESELDDFTKKIHLTLHKTTKKSKENRVKKEPKKQTDTQTEMVFKNDTAIVSDINKDFPILDTKTNEELRLEIVKLNEEIENKNKTILNLKNDLKNKMSGAKKTFLCKNDSVDNIDKGMNKLSNEFDAFIKIFNENIQKHKDADVKKEETVISIIE